MEGIVEKLYGYLMFYGIRVIAAIVVFIIGKWLAKIISNQVKKAMAKSNIDKTLMNFVKNLCYIGLLVFVVVAALAVLQIQTASFIAVIGAAGLAIGLALQGSLANFAAGVLMLIFKPFKIGDFVEAAGAKGTVKEIQIFSTILASPDNIKIIVPNAQATGGSIKNYTVNGTRRVDLVVGISYEDDIKKAKQVIEKVVKADERVLQEPAITVAVSELGDSSVNFVVRPWVKSSDYWDVYFDMTAKLKLSLDQNGISIPYPQHDIHVKDGSKEAVIA